MYGKDLHPIMKMAEDVWDSIAKYTEPKLNAVDYYHEEDRVVNVIVKRFDGEGSR